RRQLRQPRRPAPRPAGVRPAHVRRRPGPAAGRRRLQPAPGRRPLRHHPRGAGRRRADARRRPPVVRLPERAMTDRLAKLRDLTAMTNPFVNNRVSRPSPTEVDVAAIHDGAFRRLADLARQAHALDRGIGAVLWGDAGTGKSHLLGRLWGWAEGQDQGYFIYLYNLQARAERLPRYVLRCAVSVLTYGRQREFHDTRLYDLARALVDTALPDPVARRRIP